MSGKRYLGLSSQQPVPSVLRVVGNKPVKNVAVDAPPQSSSDISDDDGLPTRGNIQPTRFPNSRTARSSQEREIKDRGASNKSTAPSERFKRTKTSTRTEPISSSKHSKKQPERIDTDDDSSPPASKKPKRSPPGDGEPGSQFEQDMFAKKAVLNRRYGSKAKAVANRPKRKTPPPKKPKRQTKKEPSSEPESPNRYRLNLSPSPPGLWDDCESPERKFNAISDIGLGSSTNASPVRSRQIKIPDDDNLLFPGDHDNPDESQLPVLKVPEGIPDSFVKNDDENPGFIVFPTAVTSSATNVLRSSSSSLTDLESVDTTPVCPHCDRPVDKARLDEFKASGRHTRFDSRRKFCEQHRVRDARETWVQKGYPDIDWERLDERIVAHYPHLREILGEGAPSHYAARFEAAVRAQRNPTLLASDANLTPGYYGFRGLEHMTQNLVRELAPLLRKRALEDWLVAARSQVMYLQSVLVPELAVRLIMEDMGVDVEEARGILEESTEVGQLLNDEIPDVMPPGSDDEDEEEDEDAGSN